MSYQHCDDCDNRPWECTCAHRDKPRLNPIDTYAPEDRYHGKAHQLDEDLPPEQ